MPFTRQRQKFLFFPKPPHTLGLYFIGALLCEWKREWHFQSQKSMFYYCLFLYFIPFPINLQEGKYARLFLYHFLNRWWCIRCDKLCMGQKGPRFED